MQQTERVKAFLDAMEDQLQRERQGKKVVYRLSRTQLQRLLMTYATSYATSFTHIVGGKVRGRRPKVVETPVLPSTTKNSQG